MLGHHGNPLNHGNEPVAAPEESYVKKSLTFGLMGVALIGFVALGWMAVEESKGPKDLAEVPVIKVDSTPFKVEPTNPDAGEVPHKDIEVYNAISNNNAPTAEGEAPQQEAAVLQPQPEEPVSREQLQQDATNNGESPSLDAALAQQKATPKIIYPGNEAGNAEALAVGDPKNTVENAAEGKQMVAMAEIPRTEEKTNLPGEDEATETSEALKSEAVIVEPEVKIVKNPAPAKAKTAEKSAEKTKAAKSESIDIASLSSASGGAGNYLLQLGAYRSNDAADKGWSMLQKRFPGSLGNLTRSIKRVELGSKGTFYRLFAGPVTSKDSANGICKQLMAQRQGCILAKP